MSLSTPIPVLAEQLSLESLPNDIPALKGLIVELCGAWSEQRQRAEQVQARLDALLRRLYGRRSERLDPQQLLLFAEATESPTPAPPDTVAVDPVDQAGQPSRRRPGHGRQRLPEHLHREEIRHELTEAERRCPCCGEVRAVLGEEVSEQLDYIPASVVVKRHVRLTYVCRSCERLRQQAAATPAGASSATALGMPDDVSQMAKVERPHPESASEVVVPDGEVAGVCVMVPAPLPPPLRDEVPGTPASATTEEQVMVPEETSAGTRQPPREEGHPSENARPVVVTSGDEVPDSSTIVTAPLPSYPWPRCLAGAGLLAYLIVSKFVDHLPLYRLERILLREGVWLSRRTLCDWLAGCAQVLKPLYDLMWQRVFQSRWLHTDDTPVRVQEETTQGRFWDYVGDSSHLYTVFDFTLGRSQDRPVECLKDFRGFLHADAYSGYDKVFNSQCVEVGCWAHARRYFYEARDYDPVRACYVLGLIGQLYAWEAAARFAADIRDMSEEEFWDLREQLRQRQAVPLLTRLGQYMEAERGQVLPMSKIGEAFTYLHNQWEALQVYVRHGFLEIDNNIGEQALRGIGIGRKNWLFVGSVEGGQTAAMLYSMTETCKRHGIDPWLYLREMLTVLPTLPESVWTTELPKLLPDVSAQTRREEAASRGPPGES